MTVEVPPTIYITTGENCRPAAFSQLEDANGYKKVLRFGHVTPVEVDSQKKLIGGTFFYVTSASLESSVAESAHASPTISHRVNEVVEAANCLIVCVKADSLTSAIPEAEALFAQELEK